MTEKEYDIKFKNAKSKDEIDLLNKQFNDSIHFKSRYRKIKSFCKSHIFDIINSVITILALIVAILSLLLQLQEHL